MSPQNMLWVLGIKGLSENKLTTPVLASRVKHHEAKKVKANLDQVTDDF